MLSPADRVLSKALSSPPFPESALWVCVIALSAAKLWLVSWQVVAGDATASFDDAHYLRLAGAIREGSWLGPYNAMTLIKGPFYPLWIAAAHALHVPLLVAQRVLYLMACAAFLLALRGVVARRWILAAVFCVLAFEPMSYCAQSARVAREGIYPALTLLVVASGIGLATSGGRKAAVAFAWAIALGGSLGAFWLTREEGVWILPSLCVLAAYAVGDACRANAGGIRSRLWPILPALCAAAIVGLSAVGAVSLLNRAHYGTFAVVELRSRSFRDALGALSRVEQEGLDRIVGLTAASRERIYGQSPAFRELRPLLEGPLGEYWGQFGKREGEGADLRVIRWGWFLWALRTAVSQAGYYETASKARAYYARLATEIDTACREGRLSCGGRRSSLMPPVTWRHVPDFASALVEGAWKFARYHEAPVAQRSSVGSPELIDLYARLTNSRMAPITAEARLLRQSNPIDRARHGFLKRVAGVYRASLGIACAVGAAFLVYGALRCAARRRFPGVLLVVSAAALVGVLVRMLLLALVTVTAFEGFKPLYLMPAYPLAWAFALCAVAGPAAAPGEAPRNPRRPL
ncbi:MAG TPA: hypothetical protein VIY27_13020 [Myxococcota bacterium]